jgi:hypothetical protein
VRVVLGVGGGDDDGSGRRRAEHDPFQRGDPVRVQVLDDLHQDGGVQPGQPVVAAR